MKYLIVNDTDTLANIDASDEILMFPQNRILGIDSVSDTTTALLVQGTNDVDDEDTILFTHADKSAAATHKAERKLIDDIVSAINSDSRSGFTVLFDALNNVKLENQVLAGSTVTED